MNSLTQAILDGSVREVRRIVKETPESVEEVSPSGRTMFDLARHKGVIELVVILLYRGAPGSEAFDDYRGLLEEYVSETSYNWTLACWCEGIEWIIWSLVVGDRKTYSFGDDFKPCTLEPEEAAEWAFLAQKAQGWPTSEGFMPLEEWKRLYTSRRMNYQKG